MSTVVASASAPPALSTTSGLNPSHHYPNEGPSVGSPNTAEHVAKRARAGGSPGARDISMPDRPASTGKTSPLSLRAAPPSSIKVKKEPGSPSLSSARPRPKRLDLSNSTASAAVRGPQTARAAPLTSRESAGLNAIQDVGLACLSPGFQTNDPSMREQLQRSLDVREQQRLIIEARQKGAKPGVGREHDTARMADPATLGVPARAPLTARRKGPPPGLSINAPSAAQFADDRVIQSAPMHQTFTGLRPGEHPFSRIAQQGASGRGQTSHLHHMPAAQTINRLPPISDVFPNNGLDSHRTQSNSSPRNTHTAPPLPSPGFPPPQHAPPLNSARSREFRSADEAVQSLSGGRDELMPKVVHYGGVQPPTPPSPLPPHYSQQQQHQQPQPRPLQLRHTSSTSQLASRQDLDAPAGDSFTSSSFANGRRRGRDEYERDNGSPPMTFQRAEAKRTTFDARNEDRSQEERDWRYNMSSAAKKEEFLRLCDRAWDLFHS